MTVAYVDTKNIGFRMNMWITKANSWQCCRLNVTNVTTYIIVENPKFCKKLSTDLDCNSACWRAYKGFSVT